jgi:hypothetical protein
MTKLLINIPADAGTEVALDGVLGTPGVPSIVTIGSEAMAVTDGLGTAVLQVERGANGTTPADHAAGASVTVSANDAALGVTLADLGVTASAAEINVLHSVSAGTVKASSAVVVDGSKQVDTWTAVVANASATLAGTTWAIEGQMTASNAAITAGTVWGVRGRAILSGNASAGYLYGNQGKAIISGAMSGSANVYGLVAQLDISAGTYTGGELAGLWIDAGATAVGTLAGGVDFNLVRITNTTVAVPNAVIQIEAQAARLFDFHSLGTADGWYSATALGGVTRKARVKVKCEDGTDGYMSVYTD